MRETTTKRLKHYSKLTYGIATGALYWIPIMGLVYGCVVYEIVYGRNNK